VVSDPKLEAKQKYEKFENSWESHQGNLKFA
jgi:hypothetical protein